VILLADGVSLIAPKADEFAVFDPGTEEEVWAVKYVPDKM
jgi:hypothetical protein